MMIVFNLVGYLVICCGFYVAFTLGFGILLEDSYKKDGFLNSWVLGLLIFLLIIIRAWIKGGNLW